MPTIWDEVFKPFAILQEVRIFLLQLVPSNPFSRVKNPNIVFDLGVRIAPRCFVQVWICFYCVCSRREDTPHCFDIRVRQSLHCIGSLRENDTLCLSFEMGTPHQIRCVQEVNISKLYVSYDKRFANTAKMNALSNQSALVP